MDGNEKMMTPKQLVEQAKTEIKEVDVLTALKWLSEGVTVIDVREEHEFLAGSLPGAASIPRGVLEFKTTDHPALADRQARLLVYCRSGGRSALAAQTLKRMGYDNPVSMAGGYEAWVAHHEPVVEDTTDFGS